MRCSQHPALGIVATCNQCGRGLCGECANKFNIPLCASCSQTALKMEKTEIAKSFVFSAVLVFLGIALSSGAPPSARVLTIYMFAGIPWGWRVLTNITPRVFLMMPLVGWAFYFGIKLMLSFWVGSVALPFFVFTRVRRWREVKALQNVTYS